LLIDNNRALLTRASVVAKLEIDGIRVWGQLGDRALVTNNHLSSADGVRDHSFSVGINMHPLTEIDFQLRIWQVKFNVAPSRQLTAIAQNGAQEFENVPVDNPT
jgi:hypothetical protein